jgi:WD40 repeat protein
VRHVVFGPNGRLLLTGEGEFGKSGAARLWEAATGRLIATPLVHSDLVWATAFSPDGSRIASAGADGKVCLADARTGMPGPVLRHSGPVHSLLFSPRGDLLLTGSEDRTARLWDARTGEPVGAPLTHSGAVYAMGTNRDGDLFFTATPEGSLCLWRTADRSLLTRYDHSGPIAKAVISHDGQSILLVSGKTAHVFDSAARAILAPPLVHADAVRAVAFSHDDRWIATASDDGALHLWSAGDRTRQRVTLAHAAAISVVVFSPHDRLVLTGSADGTARLWDVATGRSVGPAVGHQGRVLSVAFSPDGRYFATGSTGGTSLVCPVPMSFTGEPADLLRRTEVASGLELDENESPRPLGAIAWRERAHAVK